MEMPPGDKIMRTNNRYTDKSFFLLILIFFLVSGHGKESLAQEITPPDVFSKTTLLREEIELIRREMGKPKLDRPEIRVIAAAPREVFFQALTLYRKANQLCFELTGKNASLQVNPSGKIYPSHVFKVARATLGRLRVIKETLGIAGQGVEPAPDPNKTPTDVFRSIVQANRQLNLMLDRQISPSDVFQKVTDAISYSTFLIGQFMEVPPVVPGPPPFERHKIPEDVYRRLIKCFNLIQEVASHSGLNILEAKLEHDIADITPGDVYNIVSLIVSELAYLNAKAGNTHPLQSYYPGRKFPSHVYQEAGILETQLRELLRRVEAQPDWLEKDIG